MYTRVEILGVKDLAAQSVGFQQLKAAILQGLRRAPSVRTPRPMPRLAPVTTTVPRMQPSDSAMAAGLRAVSRCGPAPGSQISVAVVQDASLCTIAVAVIS